MDIHPDLIFDYAEINKPRILMSADKIRSFPGLENLTDEEADEVSESLFQLAVLVYKCADDEKRMGKPKILRHQKRHRYNFELLMSCISIVKRNKTAK